MSLTRKLNNFLHNTTLHLKNLNRSDISSKHSQFHSQATQQESNRKIMLTEIFVQLLPVILPKPTETTGKILLCKWTSGVFEGRYTGMIKNMGQKVETNDDNFKENLAIVAKNLVPLSLQKNLNKIELVGLLGFDGPPDCSEYIYLGTLKDDGDEIINTKEVLQDLDSNPCYWFDWDKIPFNQMPNDDAIWYPEVLGGGKKIKGSFVFGGWSERTIKSYELSTVEQL